MALDVAGESRLDACMARAVDRSVLEEWLPGDDAAVDRILAIFRDSARDEHLRIRDSIALGDLPDCAKAAHRLRGTAVSMGAHGLAAAAMLLDEAAQRGNGPACTLILQEIETQIYLMITEVPVQQGAETARPVQHQTQAPDEASLAP